MYTVRVLERDEHKAEQQLRQPQRQLPLLPLPLPQQELLQRQLQELQWQSPQREQLQQKVQELLLQELQWQPPQQEQPQQELLQRQLQELLQRQLQELQWQSPQREQLQQKVQELLQEQRQQGQLQHAWSPSQSPSSFETCQTQLVEEDEYGVDDKDKMSMELVYSVSPNETFKSSIKEWRKGDFLGRGTFGTVHEGFTDAGFFFAVKEVSLCDQGSQGKQSIYQLEQEISLLSQFKHENIVQYLGTDKDDSNLYIFLELVTKGSLANLYKKHNLWDSQVSAYTRQILNALNYLHGRNVVHRDVKCANILVDASGLVKLADFGLAKATKLNDLKSCKGTPYWMAPEVVNGKNHGYGPAADIWSLGCTVLEMLTRKIPYSHLEPMAAVFKIGSGEPPSIPSSLSSEAQDFISKCLQVVPNDRPTAAQLLDHPFVK